jgi:hypothetical protein
MGSLRSMHCQGVRNRFHFHDTGFFWHEGPHRFHLFYGKYGRKIFLEVRVRGVDYYDLGDIGWHFEWETAREMLRKMKRDLTTTEIPWYITLGYPKRWGRFETKWKNLLGLGSSCDE